jgi:2,3-diketo-5-methylthio-1-phosphopentane phosphatase
MSSTGKDYETGNPSRPPGSGASPWQPRYSGKPPAVLCDFDDTTAVENVAEMLMEHFSKDDSWRELRRQSRDRAMSLKEYQERAFRAMEAGREEMKDLVKARATLRPYFKEMWLLCQSRNIPLAIATVGLDFYVEALLEREGLAEVPRYAVKTSFTPQGITYEYPHSWDGSGASSFDVCGQWGTCKCSVLNKLRGMGRSVLYVGDGRSDFCPASIADMIFARSQLAQLCRENGVEYTEFRDFQDVIRVLENWDANN